MKYTNTTALFILAAFGASFQVLAQDKFQAIELQSKVSIADSPVITKPVIISSEGNKRNNIEISNPTVISNGKKASVINMNTATFNAVNNNPRQVFGQVPGMSIWENDGSGLQVGVATRGLSPNRSWEFNVRQNGVDISSEVFGYPEAYYQPPFEALDRIEIIRGSAGLQFGPQFGGLLNYVLKEAPLDKKFTFETRQTGGSYGLFNSYNQVGGTVGKLSYFGYVHYRRADGWRQNSRYSTLNAYGRLDYRLTDKQTITGEFSHSNYNNQQAGGLNDSMFNADARQSNRSRNWFNVPWQVATLSYNNQLTNKTVLSVKAFGVWGQRNSVGYFRPTLPITKADPLDTIRQVDRDIYDNYGVEGRIKTSYKLFGENESKLAAGVRYYQGLTNRNQNGNGTSGNDADFSISGRDWVNALEFLTTNYSAFVENQFQLTSRFSITPGVRLESVRQTAKGKIGNNLDFNPAANERIFALLGVGSEYILTEKIKAYGNWSQSYRPVLFADLTNNSTNTIVIDQNLRPASGYNADLGIKGSLFNNAVTWDASAFYLEYANRVGTFTRTSDNVQIRTNIGTSVSKGFELALGLNLFTIAGLKDKGDLQLLYNGTIQDVRYTEFNVSEATSSRSNVNNWVENAPGQIHNLHLAYAFKGFSAMATMSSFSKVYSDANNTQFTANGTQGVIPAYEVFDFSAGYAFKNGFDVRASVNNIADNRYFTRRATGYPGPGLIVADGRTFNISIGYKLK